MAEKEEISGKIDFAWHVHSYLRDALRLADTKSAFFFASFTSVLAAIYAAKLHHRFTLIPASEWGPSAYATILAFMLLAAAILCAVWSLAPRLWFRRESGFIFWEDIESHGTGLNFTNQFKQSSLEEYLNQITHHSFVLSRIIHAKFLWTAWSATMGLAGMVLSGAVLLFQ